MMNPNLACNFANLMFTGKCKAALDLLSDSERGGIHQLNALINPEDPSSPSVREVLLQQKHPPAQETHLECIVHHTYKHIQEPH